QDSSLTHSTLQLRATMSAIRHPCLIMGQCPSNFEGRNSQCKDNPCHQSNDERSSISNRGRFGIHSSSLEIRRGGWHPIGPESLSKYFRQSLILSISGCEKISSRSGAPSVKKLVTKLAKRNRHGARVSKSGSAASYMTPNHGEPWCFCNTTSRDSETGCGRSEIFSQPLSLQ
ncbi:MAG: hypothetical protein BECKG1743E_GA0114224_102961, partial [Candidatus Kentron sp. G]